MGGNLRLADPPPMGRSAACALQLEITVADMETFVADPAHVTRVHGTVNCPALGGRLPIRSGTLNLLVENEIGDLRMIYELTVSDSDGRELRLRGEKFVHHDTGFDLWKDTTTLYVTAHDEHDTEVAAGVLRLSPAGLLRQLASMRGTGWSRLGGIRALAQFLAFFVGRLGDTYLMPPPRVREARKDHRAAWYYSRRLLCLWCSRWWRAGLRTGRSRCDATGTAGRNRPVIAGLDPS